MQRKLAIIIVGLVILFSSLRLIQKKTADSITIQLNFEEWKQKFGKTFQDKQQSYRKMIYEQNLKKINQHNAKKQKTYQMGINQFMGYSEEEFRELFLLKKEFYGEKIQNQIEVIKPYENKSKLTTDIQPIDWVARGKVSRVKNQGTCGSCYAFSTTGLLQSNAMIEDNQSYDFSEQQIVDCSQWTGNQGCNGGIVFNALKYVQQYGITTTYQYPYANKDQNCIKNGGFYSLTTVQTPSTCDELINSIKIKPISVIIQSTNWQFYKSGIFSNCANPPTPNHWVLLVGIDQKGNWKIKNSWGSVWGQNGYIRVQANNVCGICTYKGYYPS